MANTHALHYNKIAKMLRERRVEPPEMIMDRYRNDLLNELTLAFAEWFAADNPGFDNDRFIRASGFVPTDM